MLTEELVELAKLVCKQKAEGQRVEVKAAHVDCPKHLYDTLSSFSNQDSGGVLLFGIDETDGFSVVGVYEVQDLQKKVAEQCQQMEPPVRAVFTTAELDGKSVCAVEIPGIDLSERPCYYKGAGRMKGAFVRVGDADFHMTDYELYSFEAFRKHLHDDERPVPRAAASAMDMERLQAYLLQKRLERPGFSQMSQEQAYEMLNITRNGSFTLAAIMNFCIYPQGYFPQLAVTAVVVPGKQIGDCAEDSARFLDNKRIEGTLSSMLEETIQFCKRNMHVRTTIDKESGMRSDQTEYPIAAIREAVLNALIHRDYSHYTEGTPVQVNFFSDRIEIHSPGGLYGRMTVEELGYARPDLRNPALAVMTESLLGAENRYSGIPTIRREMEAYGLPAPVFENRRNEFVVTLYNRVKLEKEEMQPRRKGPGKDLVEFCRTPRSRKEIADYLGVQTVFYAMKHYVQPLLKEGKLQMTRPDKPKSSSQRFYTV